MGVFGKGFGGFYWVVVGDMEGVVGIFLFSKYL